MFLTRVPVTSSTSPQSPGAFVEEKLTKESPLQQLPGGVVVLVVEEVLVVDVTEVFVLLVLVLLLLLVLVVVGVHETTHAAGAASFVTLNVVLLLGFGTAPAVPPQYSSPVPSVKFVA